MKIYKKIVLDLKTGETLSEDSYEYNGPVALCKGENAIFKQQQQQSFGNIEQFGQANQNMANTLNDMMTQSFGHNQQALGILQSRLQNVLGQGLGNLPQGWASGNFGLQNAAAAAGGGGGGAGGAGGGAADPFAALQFHSGFNEGDFQVGPIAAGLNKARTVAMTQASENAAQQFQNSLAATNDRMQQLGITPGSGAAAQILAQNQNQGAAAEAQGNRDVYLKYADLKNQNAQLQARLQEDLKKGLGPARMQAALEQNQWEMQQAKNHMAAINSARSAALRAQQIRASAANMTNAQKLAMQKYVLERGDTNFWKAIQALGGVAGMQDPSKYMQGELGALGQGGNMFQNPYNISSQGMIATRQNPWMTMLGSLGGAALGGLTGGLSGLFGGHGSGQGNNGYGIGAYYPSSGWGNASMNMFAPAATGINQSSWNYTPSNTFFGVPTGR